MKWRSKAQTPEPDAVVIRLDDDVKLNIYGNDPVYSLLLRPVGELRAELGTRVTFEVVGIERVTIEV